VYAGHVNFLDIRKAVEQLVDPFGDLVLLDQDCFKTEDKWRELLQLIPDAKIVKNLEKKWARSEDRSSDDKWSDFKAEVLASYSKDERVSLVELTTVHFLLTLNGLLEGTDDARDGRHHPSVHLSPDRRGSVEAPESFAESAILRAS
jgi:hypothetical protein